MKKTLKIKSVEPIKRKDGSEVAGIGKNGKKWQLYEVNGKYSWMVFGETVPDIVGKTITWDYKVEERESGGRTFENHIIENPDVVIQEDAPEETTEEGKMEKLYEKQKNESLKMVLDEIEDTKERFTKLAKYLNKKFGE
ncbi:MAG: hypothetical protein ACOC5T_07120 [Elusimicrobiota bacterium]